MAHFVRPDVRFRASYLAAMAEYADEGRGGDGSGIGHDLDRYGATWATEDGFAAFVDDKLREAVDQPRPGWVHNTNLWWVDGPEGAEEYVGRMSIRHRLNDGLLELGGHIGYDVRRSRRRRGHATAMLREALPVARRLGIGKALVTCDSDNVASRRVIEANGGVLEDQRGDKLRFWVPTT
ncbi:MAG TPA: GNAT family N-acetyltransferase [Marmoricola sp.]|jgi:predicted acetyltransferase|nr:GNAT family N-acetyltransferase [Marmoricola sp.]